MPINNDDIMIRTLPLPHPHPHPPWSLDFYFALSITSFIAYGYILLMNLFLGFPWSWFATLSWSWTVLFHLAHDIKTTSLPFIFDTIVMVLLQMLFYYWGLKWVFLCAVGINVLHISIGVYVPLLLHMLGCFGKIQISLLTQIPMVCYFLIVLVKIVVWMMLVWTVWLATTMNQEDEDYVLQLLTVTTMIFECIFFFMKHRHLKENYGFGTTLEDFEFGITPSWLSAARANVVEAFFMKK